MRMHTLTALLLLPACSGTYASDDAGTSVDAGRADAASVAIDSSRAICDGSNGLRFAYRVSGGFILGPPANLFDGLGNPFFFVDGHCRYWTTGAYGAPVHTGMLDAAGEAALTSATHFQSWAYMLGPYNCLQPPPTDGSSAHFSDGTLYPYCPQCAGDQPAEVDAMCLTPRTLMPELWTAGAPLDGPVRLYLQAIGTDARVDELAWPLARDPAQLAIATAQTPFNLDDPNDASALRTLQQAHDAAFPGQIGAGIPVRAADGQRYQLHFRDVLPFEDAAGQVIF
jgi:hypothetical protein